jgi:hypothetical protein
VALAAFNEPLIYFSSEVKPYALDLAVALALLGLAMDGSAASRDGFPRLALAGAAAVWLSFPAVFTLAACGLALAVSAWRRRDRPGLAAAGGAALWWATSFAVYYAVSLSKFVRASWVLDFWSRGFLPLPPRSLSDLYWPARAFGALFADPGGIGFRGLAIFCFLVGAAVLWRANRFHLALLLGPMLAALAGSGLKLYPFQGRVLLFVVPAILLLIAGGAERVRELAAGRMKGVYALLVFLLLFHPALLATRALLRPRTREEMKPVLGQLQARRQEGERIYVHAKAEPAFAYYAARYGLDRGPVLTGTWSGDEAGARRDLETLRGGGRTWIVLSHTWRPDGSSDEKRFLPLLDAAGRRLEEFRAPGAAVYLYDMTPRPAGGAGS